MGVSTKPTAWTIVAKWTLLTSSLLLRPSQCLPQRPMVRDNVRIITCGCGCFCIWKSYRCLPPFPSETFLRVFPSQDWQAVGPTQLDTRYTFPTVCVTTYMSERDWQKPNTLELPISAGQGSGVGWNVLLAWCTENTHTWTPFGCWLDV